MIYKVEKMKNNKIICSILYVILVCICMVICRGLFRISYATDLNTGINTDLIDATSQDMVQECTISEDISSVSFLLNNETGEVQVFSLEVSDAVTKSVLASGVVELSPVQGEQSVTYPMDISVNSEQVLQFRLTYQGTATSGVYYCVVQDDENTYHQRMSVNYKRTGYQWTHAMVLFVLLLFPLVLIWAPKKYRTAENMFVVLALTAGVAFVILNPPFQECDGLEHFFKAIDTSYGNLFGSFVTLGHERGVIRVPMNVQEMGFKLYGPGEQAVLDYVSHLKSMHFAKETTLVSYSGGITTFYYWPQAFGLLLGRLFGASVYWSVALSRSCNLAIYIAITYLAIKKMPIYKNFLATVALMPLSLYQAASQSPDAMLNALCFLFIAFCFSYAFEEEKILTWKNALVLGLLLALIFISKYVYIFIGILVFIIPMKRFMNKKEYFKSFGIALIPVLAIVTFLAIQVVPTLLQPAAEAVTDSVVAENVLIQAPKQTQIQYILSNPITYVKVLVRTMHSNFLAYNTWMSSFGSATFSLNLLVLITPCMLGIMAFIDTNSLNKKLSLRIRLLSLCSFGLVIVGVLTALYIADTRINPVGGSYVAGFQGRYYLAVLPLLGIAFGSSRLVNEITYFKEKVSLANFAVLVYAAAYYIYLSY